jgi:hypothetical protein
MKAAPKNRRPLKEFQRDPKGLLAQLRATGNPEVLTVNGRARLVLQDATAYQRLLDDLDYAQTVAGIRRGLESMRRGEGRSMRKALEEIDQTRGIELAK